MKSISALFIILAFSCLEIKAQKPITVTEDSLSFGKGSMPGLTVTIPEVNYEKTMKDWTKELQSGTKSKIVKEGNNMTIFGARIKDLSPDPLNVYSTMTSTNDSLVKLSVAFEVKKDQYIERNTNETDVNKAKNYLKEFAKGEYTELAKDQSDNQDKKLRDLQKELSSLEREKSRLQKSIESANTIIFNEKQNMTVQQNELNSVSDEMVEQNKQLSTPEADAVKKEKTDYINTLEKRKKKAESAIQSSQDKIDKANKEIDKANKEIPENDQKQQELTEKIHDQQAITQKSEDKVKTIKSY
jgi:chromosome segregation ATPase